MHYYNFNIGDYAKDTSHLTDMEDLTYRRILDLYYDSEKSIPRDLRQVARRVRSDEETVSTILQEFFQETEEGWIQERCERDIRAYKAMQEGGKKGAEKRWKKGADKGKDKEGNRAAIGGASPPQTPPNTNQEPITNNQEPIEGDSAKRGSKSNVPKPAKPPPLENPRFSEQFMEKAWPFYLKVGRGKYKNRESQEVALRQLYKWAGGDEQEAVEALAYAVANSYQGLKWYFEHKKDGRLNNVSGTTVEEFGELLGWIKANPGLRRASG